VLMVFKLIKFFFVGKSNVWTTSFVPVIFFQNQCEKKKDPKIKHLQKSSCNFTIEQHHFLFFINVLYIRREMRHYFLLLKFYSWTYFYQIKHNEFNSCMILGEDGWYSCKLMVLAKNSCTKVFWLKSQGWIKTILPQLISVDFLMRYIFMYFLFKFDLYSSK
jgi:hypothetical protein